MKREYYKQHSDVLNEDMSMIVYGEGGYPVIAFQAQDAKSNNFEDFGMIDVLAPFIDDGRIQVFSVDNLDEESWSDEGGDKGARAWRQEEYFRFVTDELLPRVHAWNNSDRRPIAVGCSMGATHAAIAALRRPDLFQGCIALSGVYSTSFFFGNWMDENLYNNDIPAFLTNMPVEHPYVKLYNKRQLVMCVGQGAWEMGVDDLRYIDSQLNRLGVKHWCDFWGFDVNHDWPWWRKQMPYFMEQVLSDIEAQDKAESAKAAEAEMHKAAAAKEAKAEKEPAAAVVEEAKPVAKKPAAKRTATRKATTTKAATTKAAEVKEEKAAAATEKKVEAAKTTAAAKPAAKKAAATKTTTTKAAATKAAEVKEETAADKKVEAAKTTTAAKKAAATKATTTKAAEVKEEAVAEKAAAKPATTRKATATKAAATKATAVKAEETAAAAEKKVEAAKTTAAAKAAEVKEEAVAEKAAAKPATTRKATTVAAKKPAAKRTTTRKTSSR